MKATKSSSDSTGQPVNNLKNRTTDTNGNGAAGSHPTREEIASLACQLYIESGYKEGRDAQNWLRAEQILRQQPAGKTSARL